MSVRIIEDDNHFLSELSGAGKHLVVADFTAAWCDHCQRLAPNFKQFPNEYPHAIFLKVDVDKCQDTAVAQQLKAMPTFILYRNKNEINRCQGTDLDGLVAKIQQYIEPGTANEIFKLDSTQPTTRLRIRLDGDSIDARFNLSHTIADLRLFIKTARPNKYSSEVLSFKTVSNRKLTDAETIESAGIMNTMILCYIE